MSAFPFVLTHDTVLSRFDMIFLVRDVREEERDRLICQHVMGVHIENSSTAGDTVPGDMEEGAR
jgi:DNA replication licensing factor MCM5